jgi:hypothetical protein
MLLIVPTMNIEVTTHLDAWTRMGAKIGLGVASEAYSADWRSSDDADYLRRLMRHGNDDGKLMIPERVDDAHVFTHFAEPPEHAVFFLGSGPTKLSEAVSEVAGPLLRVVRRPPAPLEARRQGPLPSW